MKIDTVYQNEVCPCCNNNEIVFYHIIDRYEIVKCSLCGFVFVKNVPSDYELFQYYSSSYTDNGIFFPKKRVGRKLKYWIFSRYIKSKFPRGQKISLLEIGCAQGDLLEAVRNDNQIDALGIDYAEAPIEYAKSLGFNVHQQSLTQMNFPDSTFNFIVALHVMEHVNNLEETMAEIRRVLSPGGYFFTVVPCISHLKAKIAGKKWKYLGPPGHLWYFTRKSFRLFLERTGFEVVTNSSFYHRAHLRTLAKNISRLP
ncbi:MAG: class I SAM-dependent methyltransferase [Thermodesulfobacteriota bacterium]|nr:class I SAM-dependent methyltransferase [Thermodesulfobacteriota bacterium]